MKLYHWTLNTKRSQKVVSITVHIGILMITADTLLGPLDGIRIDMRVLVIDMLLKDIEPYEGTNAGSGYREL